MVAYATNLFLAKSWFLLDLIGFYLNILHLVFLRLLSRLGNTLKLGLYLFALASFRCEVPSSVRSSNPKPFLLQPKFLSSTQVSF